MPFSNNSLSHLKKEKNSRNNSKKENILPGREVIWTGSNKS